MASINLRAPRTSNATDFLILRWFWNVVKAPKLREEILRWVWVAFAVLSFPHPIVYAFKRDAEFWEKYFFWGQLAASLIWFFVVWCKNQHLTALFVALFQLHWLMTCVCYLMALLIHFYSRPAFTVLSGFVLLSSFILDRFTSPPLMTTAAAILGVTGVLVGCNIDLYGTVLLLGLCFTWDSMTIVEVVWPYVAVTAELS